MCSPMQSYALCMLLCALVHVAQGLSAITQANIQTAANAWVTSSVAALPIYGDISLWNTWQVTSLNLLFDGKTTFNSNINAWNVENVKSIAVDRQRRN